MFCLYIHCEKLLVIMISVFWPSPAMSVMGFQKSLNEEWVGGWVGGASSILFYFELFELFTLQSPLVIIVGTPL